MAKGGGNKENNQYCTDPSGQEILYLRALQGHSGRNIIDPSLQDNVLIPNNFFEYISHIGCAINVHSVGGKTSMRRVRARDQEPRDRGRNNGRFCVFFVLLLGECALNPFSQ